MDTKSAKSCMRVASYDFLKFQDNLEAIQLLSLRDILYK